MFPGKGKDLPKPLRKKTGPLLEKYQEMQDRYWDILYQLEEKEGEP